MTSEEERVERRRTHPQHITHYMQRASAIYKHQIAGSRSTPIHVEAPRFLRGAVVGRKKCATVRWSAQGWIVGVRHETTEEKSTRSRKPAVAYTCLNIHREPRTRQCQQLLANDHHPRGDLSSLRRALWGIVKDRGNGGQVCAFVTQSLCNASSLSH